MQVCSRLFINNSSYLFLSSHSWGRASNTFYSGIHLCVILWKCTGRIIFLPIRVLSCFSIAASATVPDHVERKFGEWWLKRKSSPSLVEEIYVNNFRSFMPKGDVYIPFLSDMIQVVCTNRRWISFCNRWDIFSLFWFWHRITGRGILYSKRYLKSHSPDQWPSFIRNRE